MGSLTNKNGDLTNKNGDLTIKNCDLTIKNCDLTIKNCDLTIKNCDLTNKNGDLTNKNGDGISNNGDFASKNCDLTAFLHVFTTKHGIVYHQPISTACWWTSRFHKAATWWRPSWVCPMVNAQKCYIYIYIIIHTHIHTPQYSNPQYVNWTKRTSYRLSSSNII